MDENQQDVSFSPIETDEDQPYVHYKYDETYEASNFTKERKKAINEKEMKETHGEL